MRLTWRTLAPIVMALLVLGAVLLAACAGKEGVLSPSTSLESSTSTPTSLPGSGQEGTSTTLTTVATNSGPAHDFFWGLKGDGYVSYKLDHVQEGDITVFVVGVRVDIGKENRPTYEVIYKQATDLAMEHGIATGEHDLLRVVLVEATAEQKVLETKDFFLRSMMSIVTGSTERKSVATLRSSALPEEMPEDFGFIAQWRVARTNMNSLDTFAGTFTKDLVTGSPITATADLRLSSDQMRTIYQGLLAIDLLNYPSDFAPPYADVTTPDTVHVSPVMNYHLRVVAAGIEKDISWSDANGSATAKAIALRDWFHRLMEMVRSKPEFKAMPQARGGYA